MKKIVILVSVLSLLAGGLFSPGVSANAYTLLCHVDIGDEASEAGHNLQGWCDDIEPAAHWYNGVPWAGMTQSENARVIWGDREGGLPGTRCATLTLDRCIADGAARMIRFRHLDGLLYYDGLIADDSFDVFVKDLSSSWVKVFHYTAVGSNSWVVTDVDLPDGLNLNYDENIDVMLCATGPKWPHHGSYMGQVAFDYIELWGETPPIGEGRTPGYWKNHLDRWPVDPETAMWSDYFEVGPDMTLVDAVNMKGGKCKALTRHAAAAVLNILSGLDYPMTLQELKDLVNNAYGTPNWESAKNLLDAYNNLGES